MNPRNSGSDDVGRNLHPDSLYNYERLGVIKENLEVLNPFTLNPAYYFCLSLYCKPMKIHESKTSVYESGCLLVNKLKKTESKLRSLYKGNFPLKFSPLPTN